MENTKQENSPSLEMSVKTHMSSMKARLKESFKEFPKVAAEQIENYNKNKK